MEKQLKTKGLVLRRIDLNEADQIITILSEQDGKRSLLAKGSKRLKSKFCGRLELFNEGEFDFFQGQELGYLNEVESTCWLDQSQLDLKSRGLLFYMAEVTLKLLPEEQECEAVYQLLVQTLKHFERDRSEAVFYAYLTKLLTSLGYMADWSHCALTQKKLNLNEAYYFSPQEGGLYPSASSSSTAFHPPLSPAIIKWVYHMQREEFDVLKCIQGTEKEKAEVFLILKAVLASIFDRSPRSETFIEQAT